MPDSTGKLTPEEREQFIEWLRSKAAWKCPVCGHDHWQLGEYLVQPMTLGAKLSVSLSGFGYPQVMIMCANCTHTQLFNAMASGVLKVPPTPDVPAPPAAGAKDGG